MNDRYGDRYGSDRWRDQDRASSGYQGNQERGNYGRGRGYDRGQDYERGGEDDRGFFDRAGDEVRSWFGDEEAERRREADERRWEREQGMTGSRTNRDAGDNSAGYMGTGGGWGNQTGDAWNRQRPGAGYGSGRTDRYSSNRMEDRSNEDWGGGHPSDRYGSGDRGQSMFGEASGGRAADTWGGSGYGGDDGRRFDRADVGSTGTHGAHPMSAPVGGSAYGGGYGISAGGGAQSSARYAGHRHGGSQGGGMMGDAMGNATAGGLYGSGAGFAAGRSARSEHDPHYSEWRNRQIESLDRDYDEYRREHQSQFEQEFGNWRSKRNEQRQSLSKVNEHMEVVGSDGEHIGTVDKVRGDRIILTKSDPNAGGIHHSIPCSWIEKVDDKVAVSKTKDQAMRAWRDEDRNRALFEREDSGSEGPHVLNRSFSGTYSDRDR